MLPPAAESNSVSDGWRRARGSALTQLGFVQMHQQLNEAAASSLQAALAAYRSIDDLRVDSAAMARFGIASAWLVETFGNLDRPADAERAGAEGIGVATQLLEREPTNKLALGARALNWGAQEYLAFGDLQPSRRLAAADSGARDQALLSRIDPGNMGSRHNLIVSRGNAALALWQLGRLREALARLLDDPKMMTRTITPTASIALTLGK